MIIFAETILLSVKTMISVIVPVYNVEEYLPRCIESILGQVCSDWELILVDDGSTDGSAEICDRYAAEDERVKAIHTHNRGVSSARNTGLDEACGEWIVFVDSDDYVSPRYLSDMLEEAEDADIVVSGWQQESIKREFPDINILRNNYLEIFTHKAFLNIWAKLIRLEAIKRAGARFEEMAKWAEDSIFFIKVLLHTDKVRLISAVNYHYEQRAGSAVRTINFYEYELATFNAVYALMPEMVEVCTEKSKEYFGPYLFLLRTFQSVKNMDISKQEKLKLLKVLEFDKKYLYYRPATYKERIITWLLMNKQWRILLDILQFEHSED